MKRIYTFLDDLKVGDQYELLNGWDNNNAIRVACSRMGIRVSCKRIHNSDNQEVLLVRRVK